MKGLSLLSTVAFFNLCALFSPLPGVLAAADAPVVHRTKLESRRRSPFIYFANSKNVIFQAEDGYMYNSEDGGASWKRGEKLPPQSDESLSLRKHPTDNQTAFALSFSRTHYRTTDSGKTWQHFNLPTSSSIGGVELAFHSDPSKASYIIYNGYVCHNNCNYEAFYTTDMFSTEAKPLPKLSACSFAHSNKEINQDVPSTTVFCVESSNDFHQKSLHISNDFFEQNHQLVDFGPKYRDFTLSRFIRSSKYCIALLTNRWDWGGSVKMVVSIDGRDWNEAHFPHGYSLQRPYNFHVFPTSRDSLAVALLADNTSPRILRLFVSDANGTQFVESLDQVSVPPFDHLHDLEPFGFDGVSLYNQEIHEPEDWSGNYISKSVMSFDGGRSWGFIPPPKTDMHNEPYDCQREECNLHFEQSWKQPEFDNPTSRTPPGVALRAGSVGKGLRWNQGMDTFMTRDGGLSWKHVASRYFDHSIGDSGNIIVLVPVFDEARAVQYSIDGGHTWNTQNLTNPIQLRGVFTSPEGGGQHFNLFGVAWGDIGKNNEQIGEVIVHLDFSGMKDRHCDKSDLEKWYVRGRDGQECVLGRKQWYWRVKEGSDCWAGEIVQDVRAQQEDCLCQELDYECDFNFVRKGDECVPVGPLPIPIGECENGNEKEEYLGPSGYRLVPGNACIRDGGILLDKPVLRDCAPEIPEGKVGHQMFTFDHPVSDLHYFANPKSILAQLYNGQIWQTRNEGLSWEHLFPNEEILSMGLHPYSTDRAYVVTRKDKVFFTTNSGLSWNTFDAPLNVSWEGMNPILYHRYNSDWLIWTGLSKCRDKWDPRGQRCHTEAYYSLDNGRSWTLVESYVQSCVWSWTAKQETDSEAIVCQSYRNKWGRQGSPETGSQLELIVGENFYKGKRTRVAESVVSLSEHENYLMAAVENPPRSNNISLQISADGKDFAGASLPTGFDLENRHWNVADSNQDSSFLYLSIGTIWGQGWGVLLKSKVNGTHYRISHDNVLGITYDSSTFSRLSDTDGAVIINAVEVGPARVGQKRTKISYNDGGEWQRIEPPLVDSLGYRYPCFGSECRLHLHVLPDDRGFKPKGTTMGQNLAVGNVGTMLADRYDENTNLFITRDAGYTWEEISKTTGLWQVGDSGAIILLVHADVITDHVLYSIDEGKTWREYEFGTRMRVTNIYTAPSGRSRKFFLVGTPELWSHSENFVVQLDFSALTRRQCTQDDFETWSPHGNACVFGQQKLYTRRKRDANCIIGDMDIPAPQVIKTCECQESDFECEHESIRDASGKCVPRDHLTHTVNRGVCMSGAEYWHELTTYRKISKSACVGGAKLDEGKIHPCSILRELWKKYWWMAIVLPLVAIVVWIPLSRFYKLGKKRGNIRLEDDEESTGGSSPNTIVQWLNRTWAQTKGYTSASGAYLNGLFTRRRGGEIALGDEED